MAQGGLSPTGRLLSARRGPPSSRTYQETARGEISASRRTRPRTDHAVPVLGPGPGLGCRHALCLDSRGRLPTGQLTDKSTVAGYCPAHADATCGKPQRGSGLSTSQSTPSGKAPNVPPSPRAAAGSSRPDMEWPVTQPHRQGRPPALGRRGQVVDGYDLDVTSLVRSPEENPTDTTEAVDADTHCHTGPPWLFWVMVKLTTE